MNYTISDEGVIIMKPLIYVTGASGFVGSNLVKALAGKYEVATIPHEKIKLQSYKPFHTFFYLSAYGNHYQQKDLGATYAANVDDLWHTMWKIRNLEFKNFIHISTSSVSIDEQTMYSATKRAAEILVKQMGRDSKRRMFSVRPYSVFGEGEAEFRFIPTMVKKLVKGEIPFLVPEPVHDWIYIGDFIDALEALMHSDAAESVEVGYGVPKTNLEVFNDICNLLGKTPQYKNIGSMRHYDSVEWYKKRRDRLDEIWQPVYGYTEGLKRTVKYYAKQIA